MSARNPLIAGVAIIALTGLGTGLYYANEWRACSGLEDTYRAFAIGALADARAGYVAQSPEVDRYLENKGDADAKRAGQILFELEDRCGADAATNAHAEAQALVLGMDPQ